MDHREKDRVGVIIQADRDQYQQIVDTWTLQLPLDYQISADGLLLCQYAAFTVDGGWVAIASIDQWRFGVVKNNLRVAKLSSISTQVSGIALENQGSNIADSLWLTRYQEEVLRASLAGEKTKPRPKPVPLRLDFEEASLAISRRYGVDAKQVQISIHRKQRSGIED